MSHPNPANLLPPAEARVLARAAVDERLAEMAQEYADINGPWLSAPQAARRLGVSPRTIERWRSRGRVEVRRPR
jgi:DNA-directed RNA polymerase specialized sigma24 family protein